VTLSSRISIYSILKDFAGPLATVFAATVAAIITFYFNRRQTAIASTQMDIAASQRDIAKDKVQRALCNLSRSEDVDGKCDVSHDADDVLRRTTEIRSLYIQLDEARFFFDEKVRGFLNRLHDDTESFLTDLIADVNVDDQTAWSARAERLARKQAILREAYANLPKVFESALGFSQLTRPSGQA
jgi:hypothetical protein